METERPLKWWERISPCMIVSMLCLIVILVCLVAIKATEGWSLIVIIFCVPAMLFFLIADRLLKWIIPKNNVVLWIAELWLIVIGFAAEGSWMKHLGY
jgi:hypothetical protein